MKHRGILQALLAAVLFGLSTPLAKGLLGRTAPQTLAGLLYLGAGAGLGVVWLIRRGGRAPETPLGRADLPWLSLAILAGGLAGPVLVLLGLGRTPASTASLLLNLEGVFTAGLAWLAFHENADRRIVLGMLAIVAGGVVLSWAGGLDRSGLLGPLAIAAATLCWAIDNNLTQKISASDPVQVAMLKGLAAGTVNTVIGISLGGGVPAATVVGSALFLGFVSYGVSLALFVSALRELGTARTGAYFSLAPFVGAAAALVIWREPVGPGFMVGASLMAIGLLLHLTERHEHQHVHEPTSHAHRHLHDQHHQHAHDRDVPITEPHSHDHTHEPLIHTHPHYPDLHHRHGRG